MAKFKFIILILMFSVTGVSSNEQEVAPLPSFFSQKRKVESDIKQKVVDVLTTVTEQKNFNVDVSLQVNSPQAPDWNESTASQGPDSLGNTETEDKNKDGSNAKDKDDEDEENKKDPLGLRPQVTFDDQDLPEREEDFVVFNKFGLEAPLVDDYQDFQPDGKILLNIKGAGDNNEKESREKVERAKAELRRKFDKLMSKQKTTSTVEKMWKFSEAVDIYKNLKAVGIVVKLSEGLDAGVKQAAEKYVKDISFNLGDIKPNITFKYVKLEKDFAPKKDPMMEKIMKYLNLASKFATFFGIVIGVILLGMVGNKLISKFFELNSGTQSQMTMSGDNGSKDDDDEDDEAAAPAGGLGEGMGGDGSFDLIVNGVERFESFVGHQSDDAILLLKKWLKSTGKPEKSALKALVQQMDNDKLAPIISKLSPNEREKWKSFLDSSLSAEDLKLANGFIGNQIIQNLMIPNYVKSPEVYSKILQIKPQDFIGLLQKDLETSCLVLSILGPDFVNTVLTLTDQSMREKIIAGSLGVTPEMFEQNQESINKLLGAVGGEDQIKPFLTSLEKILPTASKEIEESLYSHYLSEAGMDKGLEIIQTNFPGFLIPKLSDNVIKNIFQGYDLSKRVKLLYSLTDNEKDHFIEIFAPVGSKGNDLIQLEFKSIEGDESLQKEIKGTEMELWTDFVDHVRKYLKNDKKAMSEVVEICESWMNDRGTEAGGSHLKMVS